MQLLETLYKINSPSGLETPMRDFLVSWLDARHIPYVVDATGNILVTKGKARKFACVVAHIDEVHKNRPKDFMVIRAKRVLFGFSPSAGKMTGIGADDKNGIWVALRLLDHTPNIKVCFFVGEEVGCRGSERVDLNFFSDCKFIIQCDRKGDSDFIYSALGNELCTREFIVDMALKEHGYKATTGRNTDVVMLAKRGVNVSVCNLSCGYYYEHTAGEITRYEDLIKCYKMVLHAVNTLSHYAAPPKKNVVDNVAGLAHLYGKSQEQVGLMRGNYFKKMSDKAKELTVCDMDELSQSNRHLNQIWRVFKQSRLLKEKINKDPNITLFQLEREFYLRHYQIEQLICAIDKRFNIKDCLYTEA